MDPTNLPLYESSARDRWCARVAVAFAEERLERAQVALARSCALVEQALDDCGALHPKTLDALSWAAAFDVNLHAAARVLVKAKIACEALHDPFRLSNLLPEPTTPRKPGPEWETNRSSPSVSL